MTILKTSGREALNHKKWFTETFSKEEIEELLRLGIECKADNKFFKFEILDLYGYIANQNLKKNEALYEKFVDRYIALVPSFLANQIDRNLIKNDKYYAAWFFNRHCFFEDYKKAKETPFFSKGCKFLWSPVLDKNTPEECSRYNNKVFDINEVFLEQAVIHWEKPRRGCRCALLILRESSFKDELKSGEFELWKG